MDMSGVYDLASSPKFTSLWLVAVNGVSSYINFAMSILLYLVVFWALMKLWDFLWSSLVSRLTGFFHWGTKLSHNSFDKSGYQKEKDDFNR